MPKTKREEVAVSIGILALLEGIFFDMRDFREQAPYGRNLVTRVLRNLLDSGVLRKLHDRRNYALTKEFLNAIRDQIRRKTPASGIYRFPSLDVFAVGGMEDWTEHEFDMYVEEMKERWLHLCKNRKPPN